MFTSSPLYNKAGKCNALKDAKGIIEFYLGVHTFIKKKKRHKLFFAHIRQE